MTISVSDLFKLGIGPSSSHTMGPMRAAVRFLESLEAKDLFSSTQRVVVTLYGSLALTGKGHGTDRAVVFGLEGDLPDRIDPLTMDQRFDEIRHRKCLKLLGRKEITFDIKEHIHFRRREFLPAHPNGLRFKALDPQETTLLEKTYYSIGGGFVVDEETAEKDQLKKIQPKVSLEFNSADELLKICASTGKTIAQVMYENEQTFRIHEETDQFLDMIEREMEACIQRGLTTGGVLPGPMKVRRRAKLVCDELMSRPEDSLRDPLTIVDWVNLYALAVNEENAAGSRVVTAPTNGAAGVIPAVLRYYSKFSANPTAQGKRDFLLTAAAIGILYTVNASISGAEVGCQGEVGVACSMAAGGLTAALGGTPQQVEQAAEIGMEHNLGLTCDPVGGLVQIPCIERNAMASIKAINASRIALRGDGSHYVSLDSVIRTMRQTGLDMKKKYKETSRGGLAVNVTEC